MRSERQKEILNIIAARPVATQQELVEWLAARGIEATQSSVSRDIVKLRLTKLDGRYVAPRLAEGFAAPPVEVDTAGDNLIVLKTDVGQANPVAIRIDAAGIKEVVGTVAGDDTIFVAVRDRDGQRAAIREIARLFAVTGPGARGMAG